MARYVSRFVLVAIAMGCSSRNGGQSISAFHEIGRFHTPNMHSLYPTVTHFVLAPESLMVDPNAVLAYSRRTCADNDEVCFVFFWSDESKAARGFPITDREADAIVASYNRNHSAGNDGFQCYNFGSGAAHCATR